jgi:adenylate kinase family enzyme
MACKYRYVILLGRPGCGKSAFYRQIETRVKEEGLAHTFERVDDFPKLWAKIMKDDELTKEGKDRIYSGLTDDGEYKIINTDIWDEILKEVNDDVITKSREDHLIFIEFSRPNNIPAITNFSDEILNAAVVVYLDVDFETCWQRNVARYEASLAEGTDDHFVPRKEMEKIYLRDDGKELVEQQPVPVIRVDNQTEGLDHLNAEVEKVIRKLKA